MLPASFLRTAVYIAFLSAVFNIMNIFAARFALDPDEFRLLITLRDIAFAFILFTTLPLFASFLLPSKMRVNQGRTAVDAHATDVDCSTPIHIIQSDKPAAFTIGFSHHASQVFITTYFLEHLSPNALKYIIAHENTHAREQHIGAFFLCLCGVGYLSYVANSHYATFPLVLLLLLLRRYCEYRADRGAARAIGTTNAINAIRELLNLFPSTTWGRYFVFVLPYPTLFMRIRALETSRLQLI